MMLDEFEFYTIIRLIQRFYEDEDYKALENLFYKKLLPDALPRMSDEQREKMYEIFVDAYKYACNQYGKDPIEEIIDKNTWMNVERKMPARLSIEEYASILERIDHIGSLEKLKEYMEWLEENVYPRATGKQIAGIKKALGKKLEQLRRVEKIRREMEEAQRVERPPVGAKVEKDGRRGVVINRAYTTPEVQVRWESGLISWEDPRKLKW